MFEILEIEINIDTESIVSSVVAIWRGGGGGGERSHI